MYHSITFGEKNTWDDWLLVPEKRPSVDPPTLKEQISELPGSDGELDMTFFLKTEPVYENIKGSIDFIVINKTQDVAIDNICTEWYDRYSTVMNYLHGKSMDMVLEDYPEYKYHGRFSVGEWESGKEYSTITIEYDVYPVEISK